MTIYAADIHVFRIVAFDNKHL